MKTALYPPFAGVFWGFRLQYPDQTRIGRGLNNPQDPRSSGSPRRSSRPMATQSRGLNPCAISLSRTPRGHPGVVVLHGSFLVTTIGVIDRSRMAMGNVAEPYRKLDGRIVGIELLGHAGIIAAR